MTTFERRQTILRLIQEQPSVKVTDLARQLNVSEGTIRNDLTALEEEQLIMRVRGGAVLRNGQPTYPTLTARAKINADAKQRIARWAADMIEDGDSILLDASTTVLNIAAFLQNHRGLTVITNGLEVARALALNPTNTVILMGGILRPDGNAINGLLGEALLKGVFVSAAFVSCVGLIPETGLTESDFQQAQIKSLMISTARRVVALVDSSKLGKLGLTPFARLEQIDQIVTDDGIAPEMLDQIRRANVGLTICGEESVESFTPSDLDQQHYTIGFANLSEDLLFAVDVRRGVERAVKETNNLDLVLADNQLSGEAALNVADHLIGRGVDLAIEFQIDESAGNLIMDKFTRAGIPVIAVDIPMVGATYFGVDNFRAGHMAGVALGRWIEQHWNGDIDHLLVLVEPRSGVLPAARIQGQVNGLISVIGEITPERISTLDSGNTSAVSEEQVFNRLRELPVNVRIAVLSFNDDAALGALAAARRLGREKDVAIVGQGADRRMREEIRRPGTRIVGSTSFTPERYGEKLIDLALKLLRHEPVPPAVYVEHVFINAANIDIFYPER